MWSLLPILGCRPEPAPAVHLLEPPILEEARYAPLSRRLRVWLDAPARLVLELRSEEREHEVAFPEIADSFDVPVLGLVPDTHYELVLRAVTEGGWSGALDTLTLETEPPSEAYPHVEVLAHDPARVEGGCWLVSLECPDGGQWLALYDTSDWSMVWLYNGPVQWTDARFIESPEGPHVFGQGGDAIEMDLLGEEVERRTVLWTHGQQPVRLILSHEAYPMPDGSFWSLSSRTTRVPSYPTSYEDPTPAGPADLEDPVVLHVGPAGELLSAWPMSERLDPSRIGFYSLYEDSGTYDWAHANAIIPRPDGGYVVFLRHQDVLVGLDEAGGLDWLLGDPGGWRSPWSERLLVPEGALTWPYHQHGPAFGEDGTLWLLDNHTVSATPYAGEPIEAGLSRLVGYQIDPSRRTVRQVAEWYPPDQLMSAALGNVALLPRTGHFLVNFGLTRSEAGVPNSARDWGTNHARVMEVALGEPEPILDVRFRTDRARSQAGVDVYRVVPVDSLYGQRATLTRIR